MKEEFLNETEMETVTGGTGKAMREDLMDYKCTNPACGFVIQFRAGMRKIKCPRCFKEYEIKG